MKIIKSTQGVRIQFDTDDALSKEPYICSAPTLGQDPALLRLHDTHATSDYEYLRRYFDAKHEIFNRFDISFYYVFSPTKNNTNA